MATNQFQNMQEMANAPFGPGGLSKEEYAKQVAAIEEAERKLQEELEPDQANLTKDDYDNQKEMKNSKSQRAPPLPDKMVFHDFDYINPVT